MEGVYYTARFVDDVIVFLYQPPTDIFNNIEKLFPSGLKLNPIKNKQLEINCDCKKGCQCQSDHFDFLGYKITVKKGN